MNNEISVKLKVVDEGGSIKTVTVNVKEFGKAIEKIKGQINDLDKQKINFSTLTQGLDSICNTLDKASAAFDELSGIYSKQIESETKLAQVMSNTMNATESDVQAIKDLCSAQQELGVIGDEVQLAGAQELATYLEKQSSLEALIPVMNDMVAQQYGYNASQESAAQIATMMGKVMEGQTAALSRYGYSFTEAQEQILKFGTEEERAATLAEVVEQSVGGVNKRLAETPYGKMVQLRNSIGDVKEVLGKVVAQMQPFYTGLSSIVQLGAGITTLTKGVNAFGGSLKKVGAGIKAFCASNPLLMAFTAVAAIATTVIALLHNAKQETEELKEQSEAYNSAVASATAEMNKEVASLQALINAHGDDTDAVKQLNQKYGDTFGTFETAVEWYDKLINKSKEFALAKGLEARAAKITEQLSKKMMQLHDAQAKAADYEAQGKTATEVTTSVTATGYVTKGKTEYGKTLDEIAKLETATNDLSSQLNGLYSEIYNITVGLKDNGKVTTENYKSICAAIQKAESALHGLNISQTAEIDKTKAEIARLKELKSAYEKAYGLDTKNGPGTSTKPVAQKGSIGYLEDQISALQAQLKLEIDPASRVKLQQEIDLLTSRKDAIELEITAKVKGFDKVNDYLVSLDEFKFDDDNIEIEPLAKDMKVVTQETKKAKTATENASESFGAMGALMNNVGECVGGAAQAWLQYGANLLNTVAQAIPAIAQMISANAAETASENTKTTAKVASASAQTMETYSSIPFVGIALGLAGIAAIVAAMMSLPKFAAGGIAYGPTLGLMGEYAGASNNPEVIAPLNKLRSLLNIDGSAGGKVDFEIRGRKLVGVLAKETSVRSRR